MFLPHWDLYPSISAHKETAIMSKRHLITESVHCQSAHYILSGAIMDTNGINCSGVSKIRLLDWLCLREMSHCYGYIYLNYMQPILILPYSWLIIY